jgi:hypothetical protein
VITTIGGINLSINLQDVGLPADGIWTCCGKYERRFCALHSDTEYLLSPRDRWMRSRDLKMKPAELDALFQKAQKHPSHFDPKSRRCQAECSWGIRSLIDSVIQKGRVGGKDVWLIRRKLFRTPSSNIIEQELAMST